MGALFALWLRSKTLPAALKRCQAPQFAPTSVSAGATCTQDKAQRKPLCPYCHEDALEQLKQWVHL